MQPKFFMEAVKRKCSTADSLMLQGHIISLVKFTLTIGEASFMYEVEIKEVSKNNKQPHQKPGFTLIHAREQRLYHSKITVRGQMQKKNNNKQNHQK